MSIKRGSPQMTALVFLVLMAAAAVFCTIIIIGAKHRADRQAKIDAGWEELYNGSSKEKVDFDKSAWMTECKKAFTYDQCYFFHFNRMPHGSGR